MSTIVGTNIEVTNLKYDSDTTSMIISNAGQVTIQGEGSATTNLQQGLAKSWVNFNGSGSIAARDSLNLSSLDDNGTGLYDTNFSTAFASVNFAQAAICGNQSNNSTTNLTARGYCGTTTTTSAGVEMHYTNAGGTVSTDQSHLAVIYHGDLA